MDTTVILREAIIANHVEFLRTHRGRVERDGPLWRVVSEKRPFCFTIVTAEDAFGRDLTAEGQLYIPSYLDIPSAVAARLTPSHALSYMLRTTSPGAAAHPTIRRVETVADMDAFAAVQGRGFGEDDAADITAWAPFMSAADHRNRTNPGQDFFVDHDGPNPVACALTVYAASLAGIYAVATVPPARKQGRATALLNHAAAAAAARGFSILGLQTETGSDAERLYRREGFETLFEMRVFRTA